jgi:hypothetical protein
MPPVLIACPESGTLVPTGAHADDAEDLDHLPDENLLTDCPNCGNDHVWTPMDAVVAPG